MAELFYSENGVPINEDKDYPYEDRFSLRKVTEQDRLYLKPGEDLPILHHDREPRFTQAWPLMAAVGLVQDG